ncbi:MAG: hypothetical protein K2K97_05740 [Muribaculaceae bacterium]|nr:hypothetical protein [Muribaculaceae bacterium]
MNFNDDSEDFFDNSEITEMPQKPKQPELKPEDPDYWEQTEPEFEHLRPNRTWVLWCWCAMVVICIALIIVAYFRYFSPYVSEATQYGYVDTLEKRGNFFNTYEGTIIPYKEIMDTTRIYKGDFVFSVKDAKLATQLRKMQYANIPVRVQYRKYHASVPWRGESRIIVFHVDTADPAKILPPDFAPRWAD